MKPDRDTTDLWTSRALALLRIVTGYLFLMHGTGKVFHVPVVQGYEAVTLLSQPGLAGIIELACGALILLGWFTRPAAFIASGEMAVAYFVAHASAATVAVPLQNGGELAVVYCFVMLLFTAAGGGAWSLDGRRRPA